MSDLIQILPVVALRGLTILPDMVVHFDVSRERSIKAIEQAMLREQKVFLVTQNCKAGSQAAPQHPPGSGRRKGTRGTVSF